MFAMRPRKSARIQGKGPKGCRPLLAYARERRTRPHLEVLEDRTLLSGTVLLQDDFNDNSLDASKWMTSASIPFPHGPASVTEQNQHIELLNRGHLITRAEFDPRTAGPLQITGTWNFPSLPGYFPADTMQVLTRSDGVPGGVYGETQNGIEFFVSMGGGMAIRTRVNGVGGDSTNLVTGGTPIDHDQPFDFVITDDGLNLSFSVQVHGGGSATITATSPLSFSTNHVVFHNREFTSANDLSYLDDVVISSVPANRPPVAVDDTAVTSVDTPVTVSVLANDSDPDGDTLSVTAIQSPTVQGGTAVVNTAGTVTYTPPVGFVGQDSFSYKIADGNGGIGKAAVTVTVTSPLAPYASAVLADHPVAYWRLGEASGTTAIDSSAHLQTGAYFNGVSLGQPGALPGDPNTAARFDGVNDHAQFPNPVGDDFTVEAWINTTANSLAGSQGFQGNGIVWSDVGGVHNDWIVAILNNRLSFFT
jgi:hypothetical protein